jgi:hypothetical protein
MPWTRSPWKMFRPRCATLSFLESLPKEGPIVVGVVYPSDIANAQAVAEATAQLIGTMHGPNSRMLQPLVIATDALAQVQCHLDVLFLTLGASGHSALILDCIRRHRLVSISDDPLLRGYAMLRDHGAHRPTC